MRVGLGIAEKVFKVMQ